MNNQTVGSVAKLNCETFGVRFEGFKALPALKGQDLVESPEFTCFGHKWFVRLYPGGSRGSHDGQVAVFLCHVSDECIKVDARFAVKQLDKNDAASYAMGAEKYTAPGENAVGESESSAWGRTNFVDRSTVVGALQDGALVLEVQLKLIESNSPLPFLPTNPCGQNLLKKFRDEETADVVFEVSSKDQVKDGRKTRSKTSSTTFHAHRLILPENGALAEACESSNDLTPIPITGIEPDIFRHLLFYLYGGNIDDKVLKENAKVIIDAADKFGVVGLKLEAEASLVVATTISLDNVMDNLLYADAKNCPLLKEAAVDFLVENGKDAVKNLSFRDVPGSVVADVLTATNRGKDECNTSSGSGDLSIARVSALRKMLHEKGLDVDGSRETLIARLEENSSY